MSTKLATSSGRIGASLADLDAYNRTGVATMVAGSVVVANTSITALSRIQLTVQSLGTVTVPTAVGVTARTPGTSFTITSAGGTDTSVVAYHIIEG